MNFARAIKICRAVFGLKQTELAARAETDPGYLSLLESGKRKPSMAMVQRLADGFGIPVDLLVLVASAGSDTEGEQAERMAKALVQLFAAAEKEKNTEKDKE